jgi:hypothetical protein
MGDSVKPSERIKEIAEEIVKQQLRAEATPQERSLALLTALPIATCKYLDERDAEVAKSVP